MQIARLIKRADIFAARLSPRKTRAAMTATATAIIRATGIYPPGCFVRLASGEVTMVIQRGAKATKPLVAYVSRRTWAAKSAAPRLRTKCACA